MVDVGFRDRVTNHSTYFCFRRCRLCQQVDDFGKCEAFDELARIIRTNVDIQNISPELQKLLFDNDNDENEKNVELNGECGVRLDGGKLHLMNEDTTTTKNVVNDDWLVSMCEAGEVVPMLAKTVRLLPGERMGWWSSQSERCEDFDSLGHWGECEYNYDEVGSTTTTGTYPGTWSTTRTTRDSRRKDVNDNLSEGQGWNTVYEFEFWVMDHSAGSEVMLGIDFVIPAGIRLGMFNATAKLPGEEIVPLVKRQALTKIRLKGCMSPVGQRRTCKSQMENGLSFEKKTIIRNPRRLGAANSCADPDDRSIPERTANSSAIGEYH
ncbi:LOW QUALITY PROTEIN: hypothetical protein PHMEG_00021185 [Phytophthora megakarya]|uniref:Eukaryotic/viral aspartic protease n=1 Tax=Phytophthora megakarya TaxID=4795 RepID=A0A225VM89_9STRA|nr:LOW QUALITY PROTEIN: hypothetical protein PHMEG_00021185 [Phytophthora megakarya]